MTISRRTAPAVYNSGTSTSSAPVIPLSSATAAGDHLRVILSCASTTVTITNLNGWTQENSIVSSSGTTFYLTKTAVSGDAGGTCAPTLSAAVRCAGFSNSWYDTAGGTVTVDGVGVINNPGGTAAAGTNLNAPASGTPSTASDMAIAYVGAVGSVSGDIPTYSLSSTASTAGWTISAQSSSQSTTLKNASCVSAFLQLSSASATAITAFLSDKGEQYSGYTVLLKSSGGGAALSASAGSNATKAVLSTVTLTATATGGTAPYTYAWTHISGPSSTASLSSSTAQSPTYTAPASAATADVWQVTITDSTSATASAQVTISYSNSAPTANAGVDQSVTVTGSGQTAQLNGSGSSDPEGGTLTYTWRIISGPGTLSSTSIVNPVLNLTAFGGTTTVGLTVTDSGGVSSSEDSMVVTATSTVPWVYAAKGGVWVQVPAYSAKSGAWS